MFGSLGRTPGGDTAEYKVNFSSWASQYLNPTGIRHIYIKPATPRLNGKVERSHSIDAEEFYRMLDGVVIDDTELVNERLTEWRTSIISPAPTDRLGVRLHTND